MIQVLILDRQSLARDALLSLLTDTGDVCVGDGTEELVDMSEAGVGRPIDVVIVDQATLAEASGAIAQLKKSCPAMRTLVLSNTAEPAVAMAILRTGVDGYVTKNDDKLTLLTAIRRLASGGRYVCPGVGWRIATAMFQVTPEAAVH